MKAIVDVVGLFFSTLVSDVRMLIGRFQFSKDQPETQIEDGIFLINLAETLRLKQDLSASEKEALGLADAKLSALGNRIESSPDFGDLATRVFQTFVSEASEYVGDLIRSVKEGDTEGASVCASCAMYYRGIIENVRVWSERNDVELGARSEYGFDDGILAYAPKHADNDTRVERSIIAGIYAGGCFLWENEFLPPGDPEKYLSDAESRKPKSAAVAVKESPKETPVPCEEAEGSIEAILAEIEALTSLTQEEEAEIAAAVATAFVPRERPDLKEWEEFLSEQDGATAVNEEDEDDLPTDPTDIASDEEAAEPRIPVEQAVKPVVAQASLFPGAALVAAETPKSGRGGAHRTRENAEKKAIREQALQEAEDAQQLLDTDVFNRRAQRVAVRQ